MKAFLDRRGSRGAKTSSLETYATHLPMARSLSPKPLQEMTVDEANTLGAALAQKPSGYRVAPYRSWPLAGEIRGRSPGDGRVE